MDNSTTTPLQGDLLLFNQLELVTPTTVAGTLYGIAFTLFCLYVHALAPQLHGGDRKGQARFMLGYSSVIMLCGLYNLVSNAWVTQDAYIKHSDYPSGPFLYVESAFLSNPMIPVGLACQVAIDILDIRNSVRTKVWRVWVVWSASRYANLAAVLPTLCLLTYTALKLRTVILDSTLPLAKVIRLDRKIGPAELALQGTTTMLCTVLISAYLIFKQWEQRKLVGKRKGSTIGYMSIVAMIIESYVLESIWLVVVALILERQSVAGFFTESVNYIEIIAYLLVQYRVASGKAYESQKGQRNISSLRWNHSNHATTQFGETGDSEIQDNPHVSTVPEAPNAPRVSSMA